MVNADKDLKQKLWSAAEQLRANSSLKLNQITEPILGLIFLKFADVRFQSMTRTLQSERVKNPKLPPISPDNYKERGVLYLPEKSTYSYLVALPESPSLGQSINEAMKLIEESNHNLSGVLPKDYTSLATQAGENTRILITLLKSFNQIKADDSDQFGKIYEYFLGEFARAEGQKGGEFFTPQSIVKLLVEIVEPYSGYIYDPACGSGGMFVQPAVFVNAHKKSDKAAQESVAIYGQEKVESNVRIATMNLAIHGLSGNIALANSFYEDIHHSVGKFDYVLANPPFNVKGKDKSGQIIIDPARLKGDPRYYEGLPLTSKGEISNGNYLWMQMFASALNSKGRAGFVMSNASSDAGNAEKIIRQKIVDSGIVDCLISVGPNMFMNAALSCTLWFFDKRKKGTDREKKVLFINAQDIFTPIDRAHNDWTPEQIEQIASIVRRYRGEEGYEKYEDIKGRCKVATIDEIKANDYSLNPGRYIDIVESEIDDVDFDSLMKELQEEFIKLTTESHALEQKIMDDWNKI